MKNLTWLSILLFVIILTTIFIGANIPKKEKLNISPPTTKLVSSTSNPISNNSTTPPTTKPVSKPHSSRKKMMEHIHPPMINISNIKNNLEKSIANNFTLNEASKHNKKKDCYLIINNNVYDVSLYKHHPGGSRSITSRCGKEVTSIFAKIHSNKAWDLLKKYKIWTITTNKPNIMPKLLNTIAQALQRTNPNAKIITVRPKSNFYIAKISLNNILYEIHINNSWEITKEEIDSEEWNWTLWENDNDDK